jgi:hypothetical protein
MSVYTIIALVLFYAAVRAALRSKPADPMAGRLVARGYALDLESMKVEGARQQREHDALMQRAWEARERSDEIRSEEHATRMRKSRDQFERQTEYLRAAGRI